MSEVTIREYRRGDEYGIIKLFKEVFGRDMSIEEWQWKYKGQGNEKVHAVVLEDREAGIVGYYGSITLRMIRNGEEIKGVAAGDTMIHPKYRSFVRFKKMRNLWVDESLKDSVIMFYGFSPEKIVKLAVERLGIYETAEPVYEATKEVRFNSDYPRFLYKLSHINFDDDRIDKLWDNVKHQFKLSIIRDRAYFQWRYKNHPLFSYEIWGLNRRWSNGLIGLVVFKKEDGENFLLMDMVFHEKTFVPLLKKAENLAYKIGKKKMGLWLPQRMHQELERLEFTSKPSGATIPTMPRSGHPSTIKKDEVIANFYFTCGDTDFL